MCKNLRGLTSGKEGEGEDAVDDVAKVGLEKGCGLRRFLSSGIFRTPFSDSLKLSLKLKSRIQIQANVLSLSAFLPRGWVAVHKFYLRW